MQHVTALLCSSDSVSESFCFPKVDISSSPHRVSENGGGYTCIPPLGTHTTQVHNHRIRQEGLVYDCIRSDSIKLCKYHVASIHTYSKHGCQMRDIPSCSITSSHPIIMHAIHHPIPHPHTSSFVELSSPKYHASSPYSSSFAFCDFVCLSSCSTYDMDGVGRDGMLCCSVGWTGLGWMVALFGALLSVGMLAVQLFHLCSHV